MMDSILGYLDDVLSGRVAQQGLQNLAQSHYDPSQTPAQNARNPLALQQAMDMALGFTGGGLANRTAPAAASAGMPHGITGASGPQAAIGTDAAFERMVGPAGYLGEARPELFNGANANSDPMTLRNALRVIMGDGGGGGKPPLGGGPIRAYHGSPYSFDKFDSSKIGTGEGAQAFGNGLYFAEHEPVARGYRDTLASERVSPAENMARSALSDSAGNIDQAINSQHPSHPFTPSITAVLKRWQADGVPPLPGHMYEVNIHADPQRFLDWDKPLSEQSAVLEKAPSIGIPEGGMPDATGREYYQRLQKMLQAEEMKKQLANMDAWPPPGFNSPALASSALREAGIPGIRYFDHSSRGAGQGTSNYVTFPGNDHLIEILRKYGLAGLLGGTGAAAGMAGQAQAQQAPQPQYPYPPQEYIEPPAGSR